MMFGKHKESGVWLAPMPLAGWFPRKFIWRGGRIYVRFGRLCARLVYSE